LIGADKRIRIFEKMKERISSVLPYIIGGFVILMLGSLRWGWLHPFFFGAEHASVQGIDYFTVPKSYLNLLEGRSVFDSWGGTPYGPYGTWYLAHPAFSVFVASWFSFFSPWTGYCLFVVFSTLLLLFCGYLISKATENKLHKRIAYAVLLCSFPTYWLLYTGNMHAPLVLALTLIFLSLYDLTYGRDERRAHAKLAAGLLISFFSKPIVLLMLPLLLLLKETRRTTLKCLGIYCVVSLLFIVVPTLNPEGIGWNKMMSIAFDFDFIKTHMNIYQNNFVLNEYMKDNSIHWLNLIAQSDYKLMHIDIFSLPVFVDTIVGHATSAKIYKLPIYLCLLVSLAIPLIEDKKIRMESALLLTMAIALTFFTSYNTVWEYQFSSALPLVAMLPLLKGKNVFYAKAIPFMFFTGLCFCLPSLYFLVHNGDYLSASSLTLIRLDKAVPALLLFLTMAGLLIAAVYKNARFKKLKDLSFSPEKLFFD
jgi:hypothetical protein